MLATRFRREEYRQGIEVDDALMRAWGLGMHDTGWSDEVIEEAERLLPTLLQAGYVTVDDEAGTWAFSAAGVARAEALSEQTDNP